MIDIFGDPCSEFQVMTNDVLNRYMTCPNILFMSTITIAKALIQNQTVPFCKLKKEPFTHMDLLRKYSLEN